LRPPSVRSGHSEQPRGPAQEEDGNANLHCGVEERIVGRELAELAREWIDNPPPSTAANDLNREKANMSATQPRIWKSNLQRLLEEMREGPLYLMPMSETRNGEIPTVVFSVAVTGFNREGRIAELRIAQPPVPAQLEEEVRKRNRGNAETLEELKRRLRGLDRTRQDGTVGSTPVFGSLD
jgi:hypothetical protein